MVVRTSTSAPIAPLFIGPQNARELIGHPWRWCRDTARRLGVELVCPEGSTKSLIPAAAFVAALARASAAQAAEPPRELSEGEERARIRAELGLRLVLSEGE